MPQYLIDKLGARKIGEMSKKISMECFPFQIPGTHDAFRPGVAFKDGLPTREIFRENEFYDAGNGLIIFLGEEPWLRIDLYIEAFFQAVTKLGIKRTIAVEGYNGPAPPDLERSVNCSYSRPHLREELERHGVGFSSYGSETRSGPAIGMALVSAAHYSYKEMEVVRMGCMAPMYSFITSNKEPVGISRDHRSFYDVMRRLNGLLELNVDLTELKAKGEEESSRLQQTLDRISSSNSTAKEIIDKTRAEYTYTPYEEHVELAPELDRALDDIIQNMPDEPDEH